MIQMHKPCDGSCGRALVLLTLCHTKAVEVRIPAREINYASLSMCYCYFPSYIHVIAFMCDYSFNVYVIMYVNKR